MRAESAPETWRRLGASVPVVQSRSQASRVLRRSMTGDWLPWSGTRRAEISRLSYVVGYYGGALLGGEGGEDGVVHADAAGVADVHAVGGEGAEHAGFGVGVGLFGDLAVGHGAEAGLLGFDVDVGEGDVFDFEAGEAGDGVGEDGLGGVDVGDHDTAEEGFCAGEWGFARAEADEDGRAGALHADVGDDDSVDVAAVDHLDADAGDDAGGEVGVGRVPDGGVGEHDVLVAALGGGAELEAVAAGGEGAVGDGDVAHDGDFAAVGVFGFEADGVVAGVDGAVGDVDVGGTGDVHAVGVGADDGIFDEDAVDDDVGAGEGAEGPAGGVLDADLFDAEVLAVVELEEGGDLAGDVVVVDGDYVGPVFVGGGGDVGGGLDPELGTLAVDEAGAGEGDVVGVAAKMR